MNSYLNIQVRVIAAQAQAQLKAMETEIAALSRGTMAAGTATGSAAAMSAAALGKWGSQVQWAGRQLTYNFTLPLALAGVAATKLADDQQAAMTRIIKVYGDGSQSLQQVTSDVNKLAVAFTTLSQYYGIAKADVLDIAADWAAAGVSGAALGRVTEQTMRTMVLGEMNAKDATTALIQIQAQWGESSKGLVKTIDLLNMVENQTGVSLQGLVQGFQVASGVARDAGLSQQQLAADIAALSPAAGTATQAGNSLKTIITRLLAPTKDAAQVLDAMGISTSAVSWKSADAQTRLEILAKSYSNLSDSVKKQIGIDSQYQSSQGAVVGSVIAARYQVNRFDVLMRALADTLKDGTQSNNFYSKAMNSSSDVAKNAAQAQKELGLVLDTSTKKFDIAKVTLQNAAANAIKPLIPVFLQVALTLTSVVTWFSNLNPYVREASIIFLLLLAALGPLVRYIGSFATLISYVVRGFEFLASPIKKLLVNFGLLTKENTAVAASTEEVTVSMGAVAAAAERWSGIAYATAASGVRLGGSNDVANASILVLIRSINLLNAALLAIINFFGMGAGAVQSYAASMWEAEAAQSSLIANQQALKGTTLQLTASEEALAAAAAEAAAGTATLLEANGVLIVDSEGVTTVIDAETAAIMRAAGALSFLADSTAPVLAADAVLVTDSAGVTVVMDAQAAAALRVAESNQLLAATELEAGAASVAAGGMFARLGAIFKGILAVIAAPVTKIFSLFSGLFAKLTPLFARFGPLLKSPWTIALSGILILGYEFRDQLAKLWNGVVDLTLKAFYALPASVQGAMRAVVEVVGDAAMQVYNFFSYINPFARHSPSLVDNVQNGVIAIQAAFAKLGNVQGIIDKVSAAVQAANFAAQQANISKFTPGNLSQWQALLNYVQQMSPLLNTINAGIEAQTAIVKQWSDALDAAKAKLDAANDALDKLKDAADAASDALQASKDKLSDLQNVKPTGYYAMQDAIFANTQAQKQLQLQIMKTQDQYGNYDDAANSIAKVNGEIEKLRGQEALLRSAGAGSEVLGAYDQRIAGLQGQNSQTMQMVNQIDQLQQQLDLLQRIGQELQLQSDIKFDPVQHQIDALTGSLKEMDPTQLIQAIKDTIQEVADNQATYDSATQAVKDQQGAVDALQASYDSIQKSYDQQNQQLQDMTSNYNDLKNAVQDATTAMGQLDQMASQAEQAQKAQQQSAGPKPSTGLQNFMDAAGGGFPDMGGQGQLDAEGGDIDAYVKSVQDRLSGSLKKVNIFDPLKEAFGKGWDKLKANLPGSVNEWVAFLKSEFGRQLAGAGIGAVIGTIFGGPAGALLGAGVGAMIGKAFDPAIFTKKAEDAKGAVSNVFSTPVKGITDFFTPIAKAFGATFNNILPPLKKIFGDIGDIFGHAVAELSPTLKKLEPLFKGIADIVSTTLLPMLKILAGFLIAVLLSNLVSIVKFVSDVLKPAFYLIIDVISSVLNVFLDVINIIISLLTGQWSQALNQVGTLFHDIWFGMWHTVQDAWDLIYGVVKGIIDGIVGFFQNLYDILLGHSIIPDIIDGIVDAWNSLLYIPQWIWDNILKPIYDFFVSLWNDYLYPFLLTEKQGFENIWHAIGDSLQWVWDNVIMPVWDLFVGIWDKVLHPAMNILKDGFSAVWTAIGDSLTWVKDNVIMPVLNGIANVWDTLKSGFQSFVDGIYTFAGFMADGFVSGVKFAVKAINALIGGINWISKHLHLGFTIPDIPVPQSGHPKPPKLASGGNLSEVGAGFRTNGVRAIVGEGNPTHPEFVIPTDPQFRGNAKRLTSQLLKYIGNDVPKFAMGTWGIPGSGTLVDIGKGAVGVGKKAVGAIGNAVGDIWDGVSSINPFDPIWDGVVFTISEIRKGIVTAAFQPFLAAADAVIGQMPDGFYKDTANAIKNDIYNWVKGTSSKAQKDAGPAVGPGGNPTSAAFKANQAIGQSIASAYGWGSGSEWNAYNSLVMGESGWNQYATNPSSGAYGIPQALPGNKMASEGADWKTNPSTQIKWMMGYITARYGDPVHAYSQWLARTPHWYEAGGKIPALKDGAYIRRRAGGTIVRVAEGMNDEAVVPLPRGSGSGKPGFGETHLHFHGDLEFPNVKDGNDAKAFVENLKGLS